MIYYAKLLQISLQFLNIYIYIYIIQKFIYYLIDVEPMIFINTSVYKYFVAKLVIVLLVLSNCEHAQINCTKEDIW
jgi:hypothetical protein